MEVSRSGQKWAEVGGGGLGLAEVGGVGWGWQRAGVGKGGRKFKTLA